ncbi:MAG: hypothetical protein ACYCZ6_04135 [Polaromonas sp.]
MQQTVRLYRAVIHRHAGANEIVADFQELDAQVRRGGIDVDGGEFL